MPSQIVDNQTTCDKFCFPYWAKKEAGKSAYQPSLSERPPGMDEEVTIGGGGNY